MDKEKWTEAVTSQYKLHYDDAADPKICVLKFSENLVFRVCIPDEEDRVLRIHRPGYHTREELLAELTWMNELGHKTQISVPSVFPGRDGSLIQEFEGPDGRSYCASLISFFHGDLCSSIMGSNPGSPEFADIIRQIGTISASMHRESMTRNLSPDKAVYPPLVRFSWNEETMFDDRPNWGHWQDNPHLSGEDSSVLACAEATLKEKLRKYGRRDATYGIIHADIHLGNVIREGDILHVIDFDDMGYGYFLYDIGCTLLTVPWAAVPALIEAWRRGYEAVRSLTDEEVSLLPWFVLLRKLVRIAWLASHADSDTARAVDLSYYADTVRMARDLIASCPSQTPLPAPSR
ncbi:MAG: phosphotransferase [Lachnospiraceae bacterium]|nr:phosphotransferase [Lachnospiraceae bacterium]